MTTEELARAAYAAYAGALGIDRTPGGKTWEELPPDRKRAWLAVAAVLAPDPAALTDDQLDALYLDLSECQEAVVRENNRRAAGKLLEGDSP
jgi:hypothetical protein